MMEKEETELLLGRIKTHKSKLYKTHQYKLTNQTKNSINKYVSKLKHWISYNTK